MVEKLCSKCGEMVDEAKAFCPGCGNAIVEEKRGSVSEFDKLDHTVQLGNTMYNQMLSDMGLSVSKPPGGDQKHRVEVVAPAASAAPESGAERQAGPSATDAPPWRRPIIWVAAFMILAAIGVLLAAIVIAVLVLYSR